MPKAMPPSGAPLPQAPLPQGQAPAEKPPEKILSLDDVKALTRESDFKPFMARDVGADVRNAAMKKLFADPHYNVMDGLDIYIDDYSIADPIPEGMLRQMVGAKLLKLFDAQEGEDDEKKPALAPPPPGGLSSPTPESVATSTVCPDARLAAPLTTDPSSQPAPPDGPGPSQHDNHAHSHLRLQPDHAPSAPGAGHGTS